jgi:predicted transcriptional regulator
VLDCSNEIRITHLKAALEVWRYAEDSVRFIFGDSLGDPVADTILRHVRDSSNGLTRTDVSNIFARNASSVQIDRAIQQLVEKGLVTQEQEKSDGRGRPTMRIRAK